MRVERLSEKLMKLMIEKVPDLQSLYVKQLRVLLSAEEVIAMKSLVLREAAFDVDLREVLDKHWQDSERQAGRVREMLNRVTDDRKPIKCQTAYALFDEAEDLIEASVHEFVRNLALIAVARRIKHYELAFYETVRNFAQALDRGDDVRLLEESYREEIDTMQRLSKVADRLRSEESRAA
jgi:ferritin-like metal-binding protein YciE